MFNTIKYVSQYGYPLNYKHFDRRKLKGKYVKQDLKSLGYFPIFGLKIHCILGLLEKKTSTPMKKLQSGFSYFFLNTLIFFYKHNNYKHTYGKKCEK